ncbi:GlxA family transcriptional regulator [Azospirillum canadense]|uniref:GlxA family transcriptional regulator n=1 Tax=Azospirillum canadense TaxID=403962 RepID=UPI0022268B18|nr:GlxA family transcriptional regulator [Azospirillum canadense]MCW2241652.1 transcriptional regulator GlxA family with amidase domain [Azospirillum canadense]
MATGDATVLVGILLVPGFSLMALSAVSEPIRAANRMSGKPLYSWKLISIDGEPITSSSGFTLLPHASIETAGPLDMVVAIASLDVAEFQDRRVFDWLRRLAGQGCPVGAASTAPLILARAGVLNGYRATIHWEAMPDMAEEFPDLDISRDLFVVDRDRFTCAGGTAGLDMMLALIERQHGHALAVAVAEQFLHTRIRPPSDNQRMDILSRYDITDTRLANAIVLMEQNIEHPLPTPAIALRVGISSRQLERLFLSTFGNTPAKFYLDLRLQQARRLLAETGQSILQIALRCGFASVSHFGKCYREAFQSTPARSRRGQDVGISTKHVGVTDDETSKLS